MGRRHAEPAARVSLGDAPDAAGFTGRESRRRPGYPKSRRFRIRAVELRSNPGNYLCDGYGSDCAYSALHLSWTLAERVLGQLASVTSRSVRLASPCSSSSFVAA